MKSWILSLSLTVSLLTLSGCGGATPSSAEKAVIDQTLPQVVLTRNGKIVGMKSVAFEWKSMTDPRVEGLYVYKRIANDPMNKGLEYFKTIDSRFKTHFVDTKVDPHTKYFYAFKTFSAESEGIQSQEIVVNTLPVLGSVTWIEKITGMPRVAKIIWRPHKNQKVKSYIVERKTLESEEWKKIETINGRLNAEFLDEGLADNYVYMYRVRVLTYDGILSTPSKVVKVVTKALPQVITGLKATTDLPKIIKLSWNKSIVKDFKNYNLYRSSKIDGNYELIKKLKTNSYRDEINSDGDVYFYQISVVDKDDLESTRESSIQGVTLGQPSAPAIVEAKLLNNNIELHWSKTDPRSKSYIVLRVHKQGWFDTRRDEFTGIQGYDFIDKNIEANSSYTYSIFAVDKNGIKSSVSRKAVIVTPEATGIITAPKRVKSEQESKKEYVNAPAPKETNDVLNSASDLDLSGL